MKPDFSVERIVMQPTTLCNLNCNYCYLPERQKNLTMRPEIAEAVALGIEQSSTFAEVIWHGGEPLACGIRHFEKLLEPFEKLRSEGRITHAIQTNGTLITEEWVRLFRERGFKVGVSIDGPEWANQNRTNWNGRASYQKILRGIQLLRDQEVAFSAICVVSSLSLHRASELYHFFISLGCSSLGINVEETLGTHTVTATYPSAEVVSFWRTLFRAWKANPIIQVRDLARALPSLSALANSTASEPKTYDIFPTIAWNGDVVLLAPEFLNIRAPRYDNFVVGNVSEKPFSEIIALGAQALYVNDYWKGVARCKESCDYFSVCFGGQAGNKFFEHGTTDATETAFCRHSEQSLVIAILEEMRSIEHA